VTSSRPRIHEETEELLRDCQGYARKISRGREGRSAWETAQGKVTKDLIIREALKRLEPELISKAYDQ